MATANSVLKARLRESETSSEVLAALAGVEYRRAHPGRDCPKGMVPDVWQLLEPTTVPKGDRVGSMFRSADEFTTRMAQCVFAIGEESYRAIVEDAKPALDPAWKRIPRAPETTHGASGVEGGAGLEFPHRARDLLISSVLISHRLWQAAMESTPGGGIKHPLAPLMVAWLERGSDARHVIAPASLPARGGFDARPLARAPAMVSFLGRPLRTLEASELEAIEVDGEPLASRWADGKPRAGYRVETKPVQGELLPVPLALDSERIHDVLIATLAKARLTGDERATIRNDVHKLALAAYALTGCMTVPDEAGAIFIGGAATPANRRRWRAAVATARSILLVLDRETMEVRDLLAASFHSGGVDLGPPAWWVKDVRAWRLTGGLWRAPVLGDGGARGPDLGYWGGLHRTVNGLEAALTWGTTAGRGKAGRVPDQLRPVSRGGPGPEVFVPWWNVLRLSGEPVTADTPYKGEGSGGAGNRFHARMTALVEAGYGYEAGSGLPAEAGDTIEIRRVLGGRGRTAGVYVRASARFVEAYRLGQRRDNWERLPATRLFGSRGARDRETP